MARPIGKTPILEGEDAVEVFKKMMEPPTENDMSLQESKKQRIVLF